MEQFRAPSPLSLTANPADNWCSWEQSFRRYIAASGDKDEQAKIDILLHTIGEDALVVYNTLTVRGEGDELTMEDVLQAFKDYCCPQRNVVFERIQYWSHQRTAETSVNTFMTELRQKSKYCEFGIIENDMLRDKLVLSITDSDLKKRLIQERRLTLHRAIEICRATEQEKTPLQEMETEHGVQEVPVDAEMKIILPDESLHHNTSRRLGSQSVPNTDENEKLVLAAFMPKVHLHRLQLQQPSVTDCVFIERQNVEQLLPDHLHIKEEPEMISEGQEENQLCMQQETNSATCFVKCEGEGKEPQASQLCWRQLTEFNIKEEPSAMQFVGSLLQEQRMCKPKSTVESVVIVGENDQQPGPSGETRRVSRRRISLKPSLSDESESDEFSEPDPDSSDEWLLPGTTWSSRSSPDASETHKGDRASSRDPTPVGRAKKKARASSRDRGQDSGCPQTDSQPNEIPRTATPGPRNAAAEPDSDVPANFLELFLTDELLQHIVDQTNLHASQYFQAHPDSLPHSRGNAWSPVSVAELKTFFGLSFLTGYVKKPSLILYWSVDEVDATPYFSQTMSRNRFQVIWKFLHYNDNASQDATDKMYKVRPVLDYIMEKVRELYLPGRSICIDEGMMQLQKGQKCKVPQFNPECVVAYNAFMNGVDKLDQNIAYYPYIRRSLNWSKKFVAYLFQICMFNAYVLYRARNHGECKTLLEFMRRVVKSWTAKRHVGKEEEVAGVGGTEGGENLEEAQDTVRAPYNSDPDSRLDGQIGRHKLEHLVSTSRKTKPARRCRVCARKGKRSETRLYCKACCVPLHAGECFTAYHTKLNYSV